MPINRQVVLASRPEGEPVPQNFRLQLGAVPEPKDGEMLVRVRAISMEPAIRGTAPNCKRKFCGTGSPSGRLARTTWRLIGMTAPLGAIGFAPAS